jgi:hypothetical protein
MKLLTLLFLIATPSLLLSQALKEGNYRISFAAQGDMLFRQDIKIENIRKLYPKSETPILFDLVYLDYGSLHSKRVENPAKRYSGVISNGNIQFILTKNNGVYVNAYVFSAQNKLVEDNGIRGRVKTASTDPVVSTFNVEFGMFEIQSEPVVSRQ